jgi:hypothetical protein
MSIFRAVAIAALSLLSAREAPANIIEADFPAPSPSAAILKTRCLPRSRRWRSRCARPGDYLRVSRIAVSAPPCWRSGRHELPSGRHRRQEMCACRAA